MAPQSKYYMFPEPGLLHVISISNSIGNCAGVYASAYYETSRFYAI